jgi:muconolactone delta-isomerase
MEYLVTMTTHVPDGTTGEAVDDVRAREAAHTRELAAEGHVLRLWRPPLAPGEWRTIGLFAAAGAAELEGVLAGMPLRVWRTDEVEELVPHANDTDPGAFPPPPRAAGDTAIEYFVIFTPDVANGDPAMSLEDATAGEGVRARELARQGRETRLWMLPEKHGVARNLGLYRAADAADMQAILESLPLYKYHYLTTQVTPLTPHPSDPGAPGSRASVASQRPGARRG